MKEREKELRRPPVPCTMCGKPDCDDFMYHCHLVEADKAICGKCKIDFGRKLQSHMVQHVKKLREKK